MHTPRSTRLSITATLATLLALSGVSPAAPVGASLPVTFDAER